MTARRHTIRQAYASAVGASTATRRAATAHGADDSLAFRLARARAHIHAALAELAECRRMELRAKRERRAA